MRKLLMASAAILGASGGLALAQAPRTRTKASWLPLRRRPGREQQQQRLGYRQHADRQSAAAGPLSTIYAPNVDAVPAPGTIVIRLNGRVEVDVDRQLHLR